MDLNFQGNQMASPMDYADRIEKMYPDVYRRLMPYINDAVMEIGTDEQLTEDDINRLAYQAVRNSGLSNNPPNGHSDSSINDIAKILLLATLFNEFQDDEPSIPALAPFSYYPYSPVSPWFLPFWWAFGHGGHGGRGGRGHGGRGRGHGGHGHGGRR